MILAGDIGATHSRVAAFETEGNKLPLVVEKPGSNVTAAPAAVGRPVPIWLMP